MKKIAFILSVLFVIAAFVSCSSDSGSLQSTLTLQNSPSGNLNAVVFTTNTVPQYQIETAYLTSAAGGYGVTPVNLRWDLAGEILTGPRLVMIQFQAATPMLCRFAIINIPSNGNLTLDWNNMIDVPLGPSSN